MFPPIDPSGGTILWLQRSMEYRRNIETIDDTYSFCGLSTVPFLGIWRLPVTTRDHCPEITHTSSVAPAKQLDRPPATGFIRSFCTSGWLRLIMGRPPSKARTSWKVSLTFNNFHTHPKRHIRGTADVQGEPCPGVINVPISVQFSEERAKVSHIHGKRKDP